MINLHLLKKKKRNLQKNYYPTAQKASGFCMGKINSHFVFPQRIFEDSPNYITLNK